ncbi:hypothetical protein [Lacipirellula limnantheis]|uniref:hypothetical protein n=1 Tax=Lacipirellula limnantheis TaxID=2528024 RepID=UPI0011AA23CC|nr:hypothetical protein [Lacipirellula limnantheis]
MEPQKLVFDEVYFDQRTIPLFETDYGLFHRLISQSNRYIEPREAIADSEVAIGFTKYILSCLKQECRESVEQLMNNSHPGWNKQTQRPGVLFSDVIIEGMPVFGEMDDIEPEADAMLGLA